MSQWAVISRKVAITGRVIDDQSGRPVTGSRIHITRAPREFSDWLALQAVQYGTKWNTRVERPDRTQTAADGSFYFLDAPLPDGDYDLMAFVQGCGSRYGTITKKATIAHDKNGNIQSVSIDFVLPVTIIKGSISDKSSHDPITMAEVRIQGSPERIFSDGRGEYLLYGLETGKRVVQVFAHGYKTVSKAVVINKAGSTKTVNFILEK